MFPTLFSIGPITLRTVSLFLVIAFLTSAFVFWRRGREEHYQEDQLFDGFLLATVVGLMVARAGYIIFHFDAFGFSLLKWVDILTYPGFSGLFGLVVAGWYLYRFAQNNKWDGFEILDFWAAAMSLGLAVVFLGSFFDGSGYGFQTDLPVGVTFPGLVEPHHPVQLYLMVFYLLLYVYLVWAEYHYRTFEWYRSGKKTAQTGYLISVLIIAAGLIHFVFSFLKPATLSLYGVNIDRVVAFIGLVGGILLLYVRSGRTLPFTRSSRKKQARKKRLKQSEQAETTTSTADST